MDNLKHRSSLASFSSQPSYSCWGRWPFVAPRQTEREVTWLKADGIDFLLHFLPVSGARGAFSGLKPAQSNCQAEQVVVSLINHLAQEQTQTPHTHTHRQMLGDNVERERERKSGDK